MRSKFIYIISIVNVFFFCFLLFGFKGQSVTSTVSFEDKIIRVRGIIIVDSLGIERAILGSHLPEPNWSYGYRTGGRGKTGGISGLMLYDSEGQERGGYVTDDYYGNAFLTLDSKTSQHILLIAEPQGDAALQIWSKNQKNKVSISTGDDRAEIGLRKNNGDIKLYNNEK